MYISVSPNNANRQINDMNERIQDYLSGVTKIRQNVQEISRVWSGADYQQFQAKMNDFTNNLLEIQRILVDYHDFLSNYMKAWEKLDSFYLSKKINLE